MRHLVIAVAVALVFLTGSAEAQSESDFCTTPPIELLRELEGTWQVKQGAGYTLSGVGQFPLPPQPAQSMEFQYIAHHDIGVLSGQGQHMIMLPGNAGQMADHLDSLLLDTGLRDVRQDVSGCDWQTMPSLVGTNHYSLTGRGQEPDILRLMGGAGWDGYLGISFCSTGATMETTEMIIGDTTVGVEVLDADNPACQQSPGGRGDMQMTVLLRFDSPNSAAGILSFRGDMRAQGTRIRFAAQAPLTMTR